MSEAEKYFDQPVFQILANELWRRYWLSGSFGQTIGLKCLHDTDATPLRGLLELTTLTWNKKKSLNLKEFEKALMGSAVGWDLATFVIKVARRDLQLKSQAEVAAAKALNQFCQELNQIAPIFTERLTQRQLRDWLNKETPLEVFLKVANGVAHLPKETFLRLPVFAYQVTGNPHYFDESQVGGQMLLQLLTALSQRTEIELAQLEKSEQHHGLLAEFHLLKDDIKNYAALRGITAFENGTENVMWQAACCDRISWNVPLREILRMDKLRPSSGNRVLVVENSSIYSILLDLLPEVSIVCSSGQFTFAIWQLLRKLVATGSTLYYCGDIDPEGLLMAQKLKNTFGEKVQWLSLEPRNFEKSKTQQTISKRRLKQLQQLTDLKLKQLADLVTNGYVAYQEGFLKELVEDAEYLFD